MRAFITSTALLLAATGCGADTYDPDWGSDALAGGKADGLADDAPELTLDEAPRRGDVGGARMELYRLSLQRTDRIRIEMEVTDGDLNPHMTLYRGLSTYVGSQSWERVGDVLRKVYEAEEHGTYFLAVRAYQGEGDGDYELRASCIDGPCAGNFPPPWSELELDDVERCVTQARRCAFAALPAHAGYVGSARATSIFETCLGSVSLEDGSSCASACDWEGPQEDRTYDDARPHCDYIVATLPFYADQSAACHSELDSCFSDCAYYSSWVYDREGFGDTSESTCFAEGLNGSCDRYARLTQACGGLAPDDGYAICEYRCRSVDGAFTDDIQDICGSDAGCTSDLCEADVDAAADRCGGRTTANRACIAEKLDEMYSDHCEWILDELL
jgi:hypothetical protein